MDSLLRNYETMDDLLDDEYWYTDFLLNNLMEKL